MFYHLPLFKIADFMTPRQVQDLEEVILVPREDIDIRLFNLSQRLQNEVRPNNWDTIHQLIQDGADPNTFAADSEYNSLHLSIVKNDMENFKRMLSYPGIDIDMPTRSQWWKTPLHLVCMTDNLEMLLLLIERGAKLDVIGASNISLITQCCLSDAVECFKTLVHMGYQPDQDDIDIMKINHLGPVFNYWFFREYYYV